MTLEQQKHALNQRKSKKHRYTYHPRFKLVLKGKNRALAYYHSKYAASQEALRLSREFIQEVEVIKL